MGTLKEDLVAAKALIDTPEKWVKGSGGDMMLCWCAATACKHVAADAEVCDYARWEAMLDALEQASYLKAASLVEYNDDPRTTHADVIRLFDRAIEAAE